MELKRMETMKVFTPPKKKVNENIMQEWVPELKTNEIEDNTDDIKIFNKPIKKIKK